MPFKKRPPANAIFLTAEDHSIETGCFGEHYAARNRYIMYTNNINKAPAHS